MPRHLALSLVLILGLVPALNTTPLFAMQEQACEPTVTVGEQTFFLDCTSDFSFGLEVAAVPDGAADRLYGVQFIGEPGVATGAYIPERFNSEAMVVKVVAGLFAFRTQGPGVIVDAQGPFLETYMATTPGGSPNPIGPGEDPNIGGSRTYGDGEALPCELELHGQQFCLLDPAVFSEGDANRFVRLEPGDTVYLPDNSTCFTCNTERIDETPAELLIWTPATGFNGDLQAAAEAMESSQPATPAAQGSGRIVGWMLDPGSNCK
jgi:hypothetical protein